MNLTNDPRIGRAGCDIAPVCDGSRLEDVRGLFQDYASSLGVDLSFQGFADEVAKLPGEYAMPQGTLLLALIDGVPAGCVAVRRSSETHCEMKRLFVRPQFQRMGLGRQLAQGAISWARDAGYHGILLDTLPSMIDAQRMYERLGFKDVPAYRYNPIAGTRYLELVFD
jgi:GNAT superfamily N-acetyltransferase